MSQMHNGIDLSETEIDRLHRSLRISGTSVQKMAAILGVHRNTIGNYLSGKSPVERRTRISWAFATGVPVKWLETGIVASDGDDTDPTSLPHLDSNQEPSGYAFTLVSAA